MADNYLQFSLCVPFTGPTQGIWFEKTMAQLAAAVSVEQWKDKTSPLPKSADVKALLKRFSGESWEYVDFEFSVSKPSPAFPHGEVTIYAEECGSPEQVAVVLEVYLKRFQPRGVLTFSWAYTCSKMRVDQFGGGAAFVTADGTKVLDAQDWASDLASKFRASSPL